MLRNKAELSLVTDPEGEGGREGGRATEVLRNKAELLLVTDPEEWEVLGGCRGPVRRTFSERMLRNNAKNALVSDPEAWE